MVTFLKIAWRNIVRNKKRSLITISAVGFGLGALIFIWSFVEGAHKQMIENYTSYTTSSIQIHKKGFHKRQQLDTFLDNPQSITKLLQKNENIESLSKRIRTQGLLSSSESSSGVLILGIEPNEEIKVSSLFKRIKTGSFLSNDDDKKIIVGSTIAQNLNVTIDDKIIIMSQALDGSIASGAYRIKGLIETGVEEIDKGLVIITYQAAQDLFVMHDKASEIAIKLKNVEDSDQVAIDITKQLRLTHKDLEILPWKDISPILNQWIEYDNTFIWVIVFVIMIVVAIGILNTVLMGVLERTREFGILMALGTKNTQIVNMVAWESVFLGIFGSIAGLLIGLLPTMYFNKFGLDLSVFTSALNSMYMDSIIHPELHIPYIILSTALVLVTSIVVSIYPAWYASKLKPIEAIRSH